MSKKPKYILPDRLRILRDAAVIWTKTKQTDLTVEELGNIFKVDKSTISRILETEVDINSN